jgi:hypothetical protein
MSCKRGRRKTAPKAGGHSPSRRKALKGIMAYVGDKAVGGVIGAAATLALTEGIRRSLTAPAPTMMPPSAAPVTVRVIKSITIRVAEERLPVVESLSAEFFPAGSGASGTA